jgi:hypothetical protein
MTDRNLFDPNALAAAPSPEDIRRALVDIWSLVAPHSQTHDKTYEITSTGIGVEKVIMNNVGAADVLLPEKALDLSEIIVKRVNDGVVDVVAQGGLKIDGAERVALANKYDSVWLVYTEAAGEWSLMAYFAFDRDEHGAIKIVDQRLLEAAELMLSHLALQSAMQKEAFGSTFELEDFDNANQGD